MEDGNSPSKFWTVRKFLFVKKAERCKATGDARLDIQCKKKEMQTGQRTADDAGGIDG